MKRRATLMLAASVAGSVGLLEVNSAHAQIAIDGSLDAQYGSALSVQTNVTDAGPGGDAYTGGSEISQLSNAYGQIDQANGKLNLFLGGSFNNLDNQSLVIAIQAQAPGTGVSNTLNNSSLPGNMGGSPGTNQGMTFDSGFTPEHMIEFQGSLSAPIYYNLVTNASRNVYSNVFGYTLGTTPNTVTAPGAPTLTDAYNDALGNTEVGAPGNPTFASASTGLELQLNLTDLGYTGTGTDQNIEVMAMITTFSDVGVSNQILGTEGPNQGFFFFNYNDEFANDTYFPGDQYFTISPSVAPEPASLSILSLGALGLLSRRYRPRRASALT